MNVIVNLKCEGRTDDGFHFCVGVSNTILDLQKITHTDNYLTLIKYLDKVPQLFDGPCFNSNVIANTLYKIFELGYVNDVRYKHICNFYKFHNRCGLCLLAEVK